MPLRRRATPWWKKRKLVAKRRYFKRNYGRKLRSLGSGYTNLIRKVPLYNLTSSVVAGTAVVNDPLGVGQLIIAATPTLSVGLPTGYYDIPFAIVANYSQVANSGELSNLFDQYKIKSVKVRIQNQANTNATNSLYLPYIEYDRDQDDSNLPTPTGFRERMGIKTKYFSATKNTIVIKSYPKVAMSLYQSAVSSGYAVNKRPMWINTANNTVPHYCVKGVIRNMFLPASPNACGMQFDAQIHMMLKDIQ